MESTVDLALITDHLEVTLAWATQHCMPAGTHAASGEAPTLALWLVQEGSVGVRFAEDMAGGEATEIILRAGDAVIMGTHRHRTISALHDVTWLSAGFSLRLFSRDYTRHLFPPLFSWHPEASANRTLHTLLELARANCQVSETFRQTPFPLRAPTDPVHRWVADGIARAMIHYVWLEAEQRGADFRTAVGQETPHWLLPVLLHITRSPAEASVESMCGIAGISQSQFNRLFRRFVGTSPQKRLIQVRLESASELLLTTDHTTAVIAKSVGFDSVSHFTRLFSERYQQSPARFRATQSTLRL